MISKGTVKGREIKTETKCEDFENYTTEFWNLQITPTGLLVDGT